MQKKPPKNLHVYVDGELYLRAKKCAKRMKVTFRAFIERVLTHYFKETHRGS